MNSKEYIESGILELFVYGKLSEEENKEVLEMGRKYNTLDRTVNDDPVSDLRNIQYD